MPLTIRKSIPTDQFPAHDWFVMVEAHPVRSRLEEGPRTEDERQAAARALMARACADALAEGKSEEEAAEIATKVGVEARARFQHIGQYDRRSIAVLLYYGSDPGEDLVKRAKPVHREQIAYDHDFESGDPDPRVQAYLAVKAAIPEARDA